MQGNEQDLLQRGTCSTKPNLIRFGFVFYVVLDYPEMGIRNVVTSYFELTIESP